MTAFDVPVAFAVPPCPLNSALKLMTSPTTVVKVPAFAAAAMLTTSVIGGLVAALVEAGATEPVVATVPCVAAWPPVRL